MLRQQPFHHLCGVRASEAEVEALQVVAEFVVVEAEEMQDRCVGVVN